MDLSLGYGKQKLHLSVADDRIMGILKPNNVPIDMTGLAEVERALNNPIGSDRLEKLVCPNDKIAIITSDITRPMPSRTVLPPVLARLKKAGVKDENIVIVFALGSHRAHTEEEKKYLVGDDIYNRFCLLDSDEKNTVHLGETSKGTPVDIFAPIANADKVICLGNIEYHYFAGYSGGSKAIMPGVSTKNAIQSNHSMMVLPEAKSGNILSPVRQDSEEVCLKFQKVSFLVNVVLDEKKNIIKCFSGDIIKAHREGCKFLDSFYKIKIAFPTDIVVVSSGGAPKDLNMYQAQKALDNAVHAIRKGGIIVWCAECNEGFGSAIFEKWMLNYSPEFRIEEIKRHFVLGGHKATAIAIAGKKAKIFFVSSMQREKVEQSALTYYNDLQSAFNDASAIMGSNSSVIVMPFGGSTLPVLNNEN